MAPRLAGLFSLRRMLMNEKYVPREIEPKWQKIWADSGAFHTEVDRTKPEYYVLEITHKVRLSLRRVMSLAY